MKLDFERYGFVILAIRKDENTLQFLKYDKLEDGARALFNNPFYVYVQHSVAKQLGVV